MVKTTHWTQCILQIWINLHFFRELGRFYFNECWSDRLHVWTITIECNTTRTNWILMLVRINAYANYIYKWIEWRFFIFWFTWDMDILINMFKLKWNETVRLTCINNTIEEVVHDFCQSIGCQFAMQSTNEYRFFRVQFLRRRNHIVRISDYPRNDFHLRNKMKFLDQFSQYRGR